MKHADQLQTVVDRFDELPSMPGVAVKLLEALKGEAPDVPAIARLISLDTPLAGKILKVVNSSFYSLPVKITSIERAIQLLGLNAVQNISLSLILKATFISKQPNKIDLAGFWKDSLVAASAANLLTRQANVKNMEDVFFLGLLSNLGSLTLAYLFPDQYVLVFSCMKQRGTTARDAENEIFGFNHSEAGSLLTKAWGLPETFYIPIQYHHCVNHLPEGCDAGVGFRTRVLHLSSLFTDLFRGANMTQTLCCINHYLKEYAFGGSPDASEIGQSILQQTKELFPIFDIAFTEESELIALLEQARQELFNVSLRMVNDMIQKSSEMELLRKEVNRDELTQLSNYKAFRDRLHQEVSRFRRYGSSFVLLLADIDHFKAVNDTFGHPAGNHVLREVSRTLQADLRDTDFIARYGGEELAIILPETRIKEAFHVAERLRKKVKALLTNYDGQEIRITMSFGLSSFELDPDMNSEKLIKLADDALYLSKKKGRNRCSMAVPKRGARGAPNP